MVLSMLGFFGSSVEPTYAFSSLFSKFASPNVGQEKGIHGFFSSVQRGSSCSTKSVPYLQLGNEMQSSARLVVNLQLKDQDGSYPGYGKHRFRRR